MWICAFSVRFVHRCRAHASYFCIWQILERLDEKGKKRIGQLLAICCPHVSIAHPEKDPARTLRERTFGRRLPSDSVTSAPVFAAEQLGKGSLSLGGPWQFHLGDDLSWANPQIDDSAHHNGWEQITTDKTWGMQGHPSYTGYAWYRRHLHLAAAIGSDQTIAIFMPHIDDIYQIYWHGELIGGLDTMPPHPRSIHYSWPT